MSGIFKTRKVPRHLIIQEESRFRRKTRFGLWRVLFWILMLGLLTYGFIQLGVRL